MQKYRPKTFVAEISDRLFRAFAAWLIGTGWFIYLWGLRLSSLTAGLGLGILLWLCVRQFSKHATAKREEQMRRMIGGELACDRLLLEPVRKAAFQCALWLAPHYPLIMQQAVEWGVLGELEGKKACIRLLSLHSSCKISVQQIVDCARESRERGIELTLLCVTAPVEAAAQNYAASLEPSLRIISRDELIAFAGLAHPATDEDLRNIGRQKKSRRSLREWLAVILDVSRAKRYFCYGLGLGVFAFFTKTRYYVLPAVLCMLLYAGCKWRAFRTGRRIHWKG